MEEAADEQPPEISVSTTTETSQSTSTTNGDTTTTSPPPPPSTRAGTGSVPERLVSLSPSSQLLRRSITTPGSNNKTRMAEAAPVVVDVYKPPTSSSRNLEQFYPPRPYNDDSNIDYDDFDEDGDGDGERDSLVGSDIYVDFDRDDSDGSGGHHHRSGGARGAGDLMNTSTAAEEARRSIAPQETQWVSRARLLVYMVLIVTSSLVAIGIYFFTNQTEQDAFHDAMEHISHQLSMNWKNHLLQQLDSMNALGIAITSYTTTATDTTTSTTSTTSTTVNFLLAGNLFDDGTTTTTNTTTNNNNGTGTTTTSTSTTTSEATTTSTIPSWPLLSITDFEQRGSHFRHTTQVESIVMLPLISSIETRNQWESYVVNPTHQEWITNGLNYEQKEQLEKEEKAQQQQQQAQQQTSDESRTTTTTTIEDETRQRKRHYHHRRRVQTTAAAADATELVAAASGEDDEIDNIHQGQQQQGGRNISSTIYILNEPQQQEQQYRIPDTSLPPYLPAWQSSPVQVSLINFNFLSHSSLGPVVEYALQSQQPVISPIMTMMGILGKKNEDDDDDEFGGINNNTTTTPSPSPPSLSILYPIYDTFETDRRQVVGLLSAQSFVETFWKTTNRGGGGGGERFPTNGIDGVDAVLESTCGDDGSRQVVVVVTYRLQGETIEYRGEGDLHESDMESLEITLDLTSNVDWGLIDDNNNNNNNQMENNADNDSSIGGMARHGCDYIVRMYPTPDMQKEYQTNMPWFYVTAIVVMTLLLLMAFSLYDYLVGRHRKVILEAAVKARAMVTSLFPSVVHDRLFGPTTTTTNKKHDKKSSKNQSSSAQEQQQLQNNHMSMNDRQEQHQQQQQQQQYRRPSSDVSFASISSKGGDRAMSSAAPSIISASDGNDDSIKEDDLNDVKPVEVDTGTSGAAERRGSNRSLRSELLPMNQLKSFLQEGTTNKRPMGGSEHSNDLFEYKKHSKPIADLFPSVTVLFADISGFTAWSSSREPAQVFMLLETIYRSFDRLARKRVVFKVETIGDCYVAVTGLPDPQPDHAVIMVKFAQECMRKMNELTRRLEVSLGPETGDLKLRCGLHSGPVTAGVLRGEKSRFQLFGDTVNTASRMESTGQRNRIQASQSTADFLVAAGRHDLIQAREDLVNAKGKGQVQTFWVVSRLASGSTHSSARGSRGGSQNSSAKGGGSSMDGSTHTPAKQARQEYAQSDSFVNLVTRKKIGASFRRDSSSMASPSSRRNLVSEGSRRSLLSSTHSHIWGKDNNFEDGFDEAAFGGDMSRQERLIDWNVDILSALLKQIIAHRRAKKTLTEDLNLSFHKEGTVLDEITEIVQLPQFAPGDADALADLDPEAIELDEDVESQLREYVTMVACMYRDNFFHNFEHASHVTMSAQKLLKRVLIADHERDSLGNKSEHASPTHDLVDYTYGITSDPLTQFAVVFSAMIHDVDHTGVPNNQLIKEKAHIAGLYKDRSVAEQNSFDLAWDLLMDSSYCDLHRAIFANNNEVKYFRQLVVNVVLATDIFDKDMKAIRNSRFEKAFHKESLQTPLTEVDERNLKTTIVIEYIMQASDVSHTMQHWQVYQTWNERLFEEMYSAWKVNRGEKNPADGWYKGELWFFDNYIIPLAKKLKECGAFGAASDECLNYALANRKEWAARGEEIVQGFVAKHTKKGKSGL